MFKKRNLLIFLLIFILSITVVSANELANDTAINCKNRAVLSEINIDEYSQDEYILGNESDTIIATDVVDENSFTASFLDNSGNPLTDPYSEVRFKVHNSDNSYANEFWFSPDSTGTATVEKLLPKGSYIVEISNFLTNQNQKILVEHYKNG